MKALLIRSLCLFFACSSAALAGSTGYFCNKGGYIYRVYQGYPLDNNVIGISIKDTNGAVSHWTTQGYSNAEDNPSARSLLAMAITAYLNRTYVYVTAYTAADCTTLYTLGDGQSWRGKWSGLMFPQGPGAY